MCCIVPQWYISGVVYYLCGRNPEQTGNSNKRLTIIEAIILIHLSQLQFSTALWLGAIYPNLNAQWVRSLKDPLDLGHRGYYTLSNEGVFHCSQLGVHAMPMQSNKCDPLLYSKERLMTCMWLQCMQWTEVHWCMQWMNLCGHRRPQTLCPSVPTKVHSLDQSMKYPSTIFHWLDWLIMQ